MRPHLLFPPVKTANLYLAFVESYRRNTHPPSFLEWAVVTIQRVSSQSSKAFISNIFYQKSNPADYNTT